MDEFYFFGSEEVGYGLCQFICHNEEKPVFSFNGVQKKIISDSLMERFIPKSQYLGMTGTEILVKIQYYRRLDNLPDISPNLSSDNCLVSSIIEESGEITEEIFKTLSSLHTPSPWSIGTSGSTIIYANSNFGKVIARVFDNDTLVRKKFNDGEADANIKRIVECVNACDGIDNPHTFIKYAKETLESGALHNAAYAREIEELRNKINELESILLMVPVPKFADIKDVPMWALKLEAYKLSK